MDTFRELLQYAESVVDIDFKEYVLPGLRKSFLDLLAMGKL
jgi:hypothetical protein